VVWEITKPLHLHKGASVLYRPFLAVHQPHSGKHSGKTGTNLTATSEHVILLEVILAVSKGDSFHQSNWVILKKVYCCDVFCPLVPFKGVCTRCQFYVVRMFTLGERKFLNLKDEYIQEYFLSGPHWKT